jgi:hypothetical protein
MTERDEPQNSIESEDIEISLSFRLAHLGIDTAAIYPKLTAQQIADVLGVDSNAVRRPLKNFDIETEQMFHEHQQEYFDYYPHYTLDLIREEREWREWYLSFPQKVNANQVAEAIGRSYGFVSKTLSELYPNTRKQKHGHNSRLYPRVSIQKLRDITFATPPDENWPTIPRLVEFTGHDRAWVLNRLSHTSIRPESRRQAVTGREFPHYPPDVFDVLQGFMNNTPPPAGNWLTANAIEDLLGKSGNWVAKRLEDSYLPSGEPRLDDMAVERIHYPPSTVQSLKDELVQLNSHEIAGNWATISTLKARLGMHAVTLTRLLDQIEVESELRLDLKGRPKLHFSPETQAKLATVAMEIYAYPEAEGWVTFTVAQKIICRSAGWIRAQFNELGISPEIRLDKSRRPLDHFDIEVIIKIKDLGDTLDAGSMLSIDDIAERLNKSKTWVISRLAKINITPEKRFSKFGKFIDHYPESIIDSITDI